MIIIFTLLIRPPPRSPLFPYTTLFRSKDAVQHVTYTITVPDDASLIGKKIVDRAKATSGSVESRSDLVEVLVLPAPCTENCPSPTPTPTPTETSTPTPTPTVAATQPTKVKGLTLGQTGESDRSTI